MINQDRLFIINDEFCLLKMAETPGQDPALDFDCFVSNINSAQRFATTSGAPLTPVQIFDQLQQGLPQ